MRDFPGFVLGFRLCQFLQACDGGRVAGPGGCFVVLKSQPCLAGYLVPGAQVVGGFKGSGSYYASGFRVFAQRQAGFVALLNPGEKGYVAVYVGEYSPHVE